MIAAAPSHDRYRSRLEEERQQLQARMRQEEQEIKQWNEETGVRTLELESNYNCEYLIATYAHHRRRLKSVVQGLERIEDGTFGVCEACSSPIAEKRLEVLPFARYCITCQEEAETGRIM